ncbi:MAG: DNA repair exonuclease [Bacillota bacterium]|nr:DNA repair exonuclease [Bacillota bacterium]
MRFLHTGDVHLSPAAPERFDAFRAVFGLAKELDCAALLVAGDLFDSVEAAGELRPRVRELFNSHKIEVYIVPGNHDRTAYGAGEHYGINVHTAQSSSPVLWRAGEIGIVGLPYSFDRPSFEDLRAQTLLEKESPLIVLAHANFFSSAFGRVYTPDAENAGESCLWDHDFDEFPPAYVALGHWHNPTLPLVEINRVRVAYSGSPYPLARGENGARKVFLIEISSGEIKVEAVDIPGVPRRETAAFYFVPGAEEETLEAIRSVLRDRADPNVILDLEMGGWVSRISEELLVKKSEALIEEFRGGWKGVNPGTPCFLSTGRLSGIGSRCFQILQESEIPPDIIEAEVFRNTVLYGFAEKVIGDREALYREALALILRHLGRGTLHADS